VIERDLQDYLFANPDILFPGQKIQEKAREYQIQGKRIDILFVVDGTRYIVELKKVPIKREHIGQIVEYYGLMKSYLHEANLKMILVSPSIPEFRRAYLEELGPLLHQHSQCPTAGGVVAWSGVGTGGFGRSHRRDLGRHSPTTDVVLGRGDRGHAVRDHGRASEPRRGAADAAFHIMKFVDH
jgi:hypothetical protein